MRERKRNQKKSPVGWGREIAIVPGIRHVDICSPVAAAGEKQCRRQRPDEARTDCILEAEIVNVTFEAFKGTKGIQEINDGILGCFDFLYNPNMNTLRDEVSGFLHKHGIRLNTDLGQHFLVEEDALESIVDAANLKPDDHVVEIGPGIGILTRELLKHATSVTAIEIDGKLIPLLNSFLKNSSVSSASSVSSESSLKIIHDNALHVPLPNAPYKIVANIPYHITSPLLRHVFLESPQIPSSLTLLIQKEVAETICDARSAGILTILVRLFGEPRYVCNVPAKAFLPPPAVDSAVLHVDCFPEPLAEPETIERIFRLTKLAFGQKRKMLRNTLGSLPNGLELLASEHIEPTRRPQTLTVQEWIALAKRQDVP